MTISADAASSNDGPKALNIDWGVPPGKAIVSAKDLELPDFANCRNNFQFNR